MSRRLARPFHTGASLRVRIFEIGKSSFTEIHPLGLNRVRTALCNVSAFSCSPAKGFAEIHVKHGLPPRRMAGPGRYVFLPS